MINLFELDQLIILYEFLTLKKKCLPRINFMTILFYVFDQIK